MVKWSLNLIAFVLGMACASGQNALPTLIIDNAMVDTLLHRITVHYSVFDDQSSQVEVSLSLSTDGGTSYPFSALDATGDVGFPVTVGAGKSVVWAYPDTLQFSLSNLRVLLAADDHDVFDIQSIIDQVDTLNLLQSLEWVQGIRHRTTGLQHLTHVRDSLVQIFSDHGLTTRLHNVPYNGGYNGKNVVGRKPGLVYNGSTYILDGHYDTVSQSPGADDNASAWAGLLEILRIIAPFRFKHTVEFIAFDLEEAGLQGSLRYVQDGILPYEDIAGVINADMIGYYTEVPNSQTFPAGMEQFYPDLFAQLAANEFRGNFIISTPNTYSMPLANAFDSLAAIYVPDLMIGTVQIPGNGELVPDARRSDHANFWDAGYRALHLSDGADSRNPNYHSATDTLGTLHFPFMAKVTKAMLALILHLAQPVHADTISAHVAIDPEMGLGQTRSNPCALHTAPNPTNGCIKLWADCAKGGERIILSSVGGDQLATYVLSTNGQAEIDLSELHAGTYVFSTSINGKALAVRAVLRN